MHKRINLNQQQQQEQQWPQQAEQQEGTGCYPAMLSFAQARTA